MSHDTTCPPTLTDLGITRDESSRYQKLADLPEKHFETAIAVAKSTAGQVTTAAMLRTAKQQTRIERKEEKQQATEQARAQIEQWPSDAFSIRCCQMQDLLSDGTDFDCIITDPPYPLEFLPLYEELARLAASVPLVAVMCGQSYLPEVIASMTRHLRYRWTIAYLTPGGQSVQQWQAKAITSWKPVLLFGESIEWFGDVARSETNDNDKRFHGWGQSVSGMTDLITRLTKPGAIICDPFCGAGTTGVSALLSGRRFVGCDIDAQHVETATERCLRAARGWSE
jgi:site-specific DNA-methyltransferase (adenine-specific)